MSICLSFPFGNTIRFLHAVILQSKNIFTSYFLEPRFVSLESHRFNLCILIFKLNEIFINEIFLCKTRQNIKKVLVTLPVIEGVTTVTSPPIL